MTNLHKDIKRAANQPFKKTEKIGKDFILKALTEIAKNNDPEEMSMSIEDLLEQIKEGYSE